MTYHINKRGKAAPCRAKKRYCPLGGSFDSKELATNEANRVSNEYSDKNENVNNTMKNEVSEKMEKGNWKNVEKTMHNYNSASIEPVYEKIRELREKGEDGLSIHSSLIEKSNAISGERNNITSKIEDDFLNSSKEGQDLRNAQNEEDKFISDNSDSKYISKENEREFESKLKELSNKKALAKANFDKKVLAEASKNPRFNELGKELEEHKSKVSAANYIYHYEMDARAKKKPLPEKTPIEEYYESRKEAEEKIENKIGLNYLVANSSGMGAGRLEINEELVMDNKGRIANLYYEKEPGVPVKVSRIHKEKNGNIELEDGTIFSIKNKDSSREDFEVGSHRFYVTPPKGRTKYTGDSWFEIEEDELVK